MMDVDSPSQSNQNEEYKARKNRIIMYKTILNYYKGRSLSLDYILASYQPSIDVPPDMRSYDGFCKNVEGLYDDITLVQCIKNCLKLVYCSLASTEIMSMNETNVKRDIINKIEGIIYFSKSIMKLYNDNFNELELIQKMKNHSSVINEYLVNLRKVKENERTDDNDETSREKEKSELQIYKINLMRNMKSVLIGYISSECPGLFEKTLPFMTSVRRDLTLDDFRETWDVGLTS